jgi:hypothetical protein
MTVSDVLGSTRPRQNAVSLSKQLEMNRPQSIKSNAQTGSSCIPIAPKFQPFYTSLDGYGAER